MFEGLGVLQEGCKRNMKKFLIKEADFCPAAKISQFFVIKKLDLDSDHVSGS
jgi:hypothetical protein